MPTICKFNKYNIKCTKSATYNFKDQKKRLYCNEHKEPGMVNIKIDNRICITCKEQGESKRCSFNFPDEKKPKFCKAHSHPGMINLNSKNNKCKGCHKKQPCYGILGEKATHCSKCATNDMVDLVSNLCHNQNCRKNATYGIPGEKATSCKKHADLYMIDVKNKRCIVCLALGIKNPKQPTFGFEKITHCIQHKEENMTDLRHDTERCKVCKKRSTYGYEGKTPEYCAQHKLDNMVDVVSAMCEKCGKIQGVFGYDKNNLYCKGCSEENMKNVKAKMCEKCNEKQPKYNYPKEKRPRFCNGCKLDGMTDIINFKCASCGLYCVRSKISKCAYCKPKSTLRQKTKEMKVVNFLQENKIELIHNKSVGYVCGNYRPDVRIDAGTHLVIVEIDEDQHRHYEQSCEVVRMLNIHQSEGLRCVFLRYNPDIVKYNNKTVRIYENKRLDLLLDRVRYHIKNVPEDEITVYRLYYNNDTGDNIIKYDIGYESSKLLQKLKEEQF